MISLISALAVFAAPLYYETPAGRRYAQVNPGGVTILPNGRLLTPIGERWYTGADLWQVIVSPDGQTTVGFDDSGLTTYRNGVKRVIAMKGVAPAGVYFPDGRRLLVSLGEAGKVAILDAESFAVQKEIALSDLKDSYINDIAITADGKLAYGVDVANQDLITFDLEAGTVLSRVKAGREPYALVLAKDGKSLYVANIGLFDYTIIPKPDAGENWSSRGISRPPFGFPTRESEKGVRFEGRNVAGIGKTGSPDAQSVWSYSLNNPSRPVADRKAISGLLIHKPTESGKAVGGSAPNELLLVGNNLFVANANNDSISVFSTKDLKLRRTISLRLTPELSRYRGVIPSGMVASTDESTLYVCESGINAVASIDVQSGTVNGHIPTGWFPMQIATVGGKIAVATQKGLGRGPQGPLDPRSGTDERFGLTAMPGMINVFAPPSKTELKSLTQLVLRNNGLIPSKLPKTPNPIPYVPGKPSDQIKYVVFITKENHTFDGIFGGLKGSRSRAEYAEYGRNGWIREKGKAERVPIMPNHINLAERFAISDNFYMEPQASGDGHRWLNGVYPSLWTTRVFYAGWDMKDNDRAKGRLVSFGSNGGPIPEDYLENGSLWEHLGRGGIPFRNYGEGFEFPGVDEGEDTEKSGGWEPVNFPMSKVLYDNTCFDFPIFNMNIPDIARVQWFKDDVLKYRQKHGGKIPKFMNICLCNDHGSNPNEFQKKFGYPYNASFMADNDLALGRTVEYLSHTPEWKNMAIFVTQDDSGGDNDSVDRHRSFVLAISPYAKKGYVSKDHSSIMSIIKTIYLAFGLGPNNMFDAVTTSLNDMFTMKPDFTPYKAENADPRVFRPQATIDPSDPKYTKRRAMKSIQMDDPEYVEGLRRGGR